MLNQIIFFVTIIIDSFYQIDPIINRGIYLY